MRGREDGQAKQRDEAGQFGDISLSELMLHAREQVLAATRTQRADGGPDTLRVNSLTIEVNVVASRTREGEGGLDIKVLSIGGKRVSEHEKIHKITVELEALSDNEIAQAGQRLNPAETNRNWVDDKTMRVNVGL
jgi:hypothetical protein